MKYFAKFNLAAIIATMPAILSAHDGHGVAEGTSMTHYIFSPMHAIPLVAVVVVGAAIYFYRKKQVASK